MDTKEAVPDHGASRRRRWSLEMKRRLVLESLAAGASVSVVARRYDVNANQLFTWRRLEREGRLGDGAAAARLIPVKIVPALSVASPPGPTDGKRAAKDVWRLG
jgi:transposase